MHAFFFTSSSSSGMCTLWTELALHTVSVSITSLIGQKQSWPGWQEVYWFQIRKRMLRNISLSCKCNGVGWFLFLKICIKQKLKSSFLSYSQLFCLGLDFVHRKLIGSLDCCYLLLLFSHVTGFSRQKLNKTILKSVSSENLCDLGQ